MKIVVLFCIIYVCGSQEPFNCYSGSVQNLEGPDTSQLEKCTNEHICVADVTLVVADDPNRGITDVQYRCKNNIDRCTGAAACRGRQNGQIKVCCCFESECNSSKWIKELFRSEQPAAKPQPKAFFQVAAVTIPSTATSMATPLATAASMTITSATSSSSSLNDSVTTSLNSTSLSSSSTDSVTTTLPLCSEGEEQVCATNNDCSCHEATSAICRANGKVLYCYEESNRPCQCQEWDTVCGDGKFPKNCPQWKRKRYVDVEIHGCSCDY